jgi:deoxyribodipyrimidine photolyase
METAIVLFTRDLRLHDNPALHLACRQARQVLPLFVADPAIPAPPNRRRFLRDALADLRDGFRERGADLVIRNGDPTAEVIKLARETTADAIYVAGDVSRYAARRRRNLERDCQAHRLALTVTPGLTVVDWRPGYRHFGQLLADGDVACNAGNWQWVAGTGNSTRPNRVMNPLRQAQRFDPAGEYVRRYVPELAGLDPQYLQTPWKSKAGHLGYPDPIVELG